MSYHIMLLLFLRDTDLERVAFVTARLYHSVGHSATCWFAFQDVSAPCGRQEAASKQRGLQADMASFFTCHAAFIFS